MILIAVLCFVFVFPVCVIWLASRYKINEKWWCFWENANSIAKWWCCVVLKKVSTFVWGPIHSHLLHLSFSFSCGFFFFIFFSRFFFGLFLSFGMHKRNMIMFRHPTTYIPAHTFKPHTLYTFLFLLFVFSLSVIVVFFHTLLIFYLFPFEPIKV